MRLFGTAKETFIIDVCLSIRYRDDIGEGQRSQGGFERQTADQMQSHPDIICSITLTPIIARSVSPPMPCHSMNSKKIEEQEDILNKYQHLFTTIT